MAGSTAEKFICIVSSSDTKLSILTNTIEENSKFSRVGVSLHSLSIFEVLSL